MSANLQSSEFMEVGGEERGAANLLHEVLRDCPGQAEAIICACAAAQLINDHQRLGACTLPHNRFRHPGAAFAARQTYHRV